MFRIENFANIVGKNLVSKTPTPKLQKCFVNNWISFIRISITCFSWIESVSKNFLNINLTMDSSKR